MDLGVLEGQTSRGLFSNSIFDPSVIGASAHPAHQAPLVLGILWKAVCAGLCCGQRKYDAVHFCYGHCFIVYSQMPVW